MEVNQCYILFTGWNLTKKVALSWTHCGYRRLSFSSRQHRPRYEMRNDMGMMIKDLLSERGGGGFAAARDDGGGRVANTVDTKKHTGDAGQIRYK
jgi:hypothetical protein